ncbi:MAG: hypothetical protein ACPGRZ_13755 [Alphaproteobacteria bacterium]
MSTRSIRISLTDLIPPLIALAVAFACAPAFSQQQPTPFPWEKNADRFLRQGLPKIENPIDKRINEGLKRLGLPPQPKLDITGETVPQEQPPGLSETVMPTLDQNRNGFVSRDEYMRSRRGLLHAGRRGAEYHIRRDQRFDSRFRDADRNRDGRLSPDEIDRMKGRRF